MVAAKGLRIVESDHDRSLIFRYFGRGKASWSPTTGFERAARRRYCHGDRSRIAGERHGRHGRTSEGPADRYEVAGMSRVAEPRVEPDGMGDGPGGASIA